MQKETRRAGACKRRRDLAANVPGLSHARNDDAPLTSAALETDGAGPRKFGTQPIDERGDSRCLDGKRAFTESDQSRIVEFGGHFRLFLRGAPS